MEEDSYSMTPPNSPILQAGLFEVNRIDHDNDVLQGIVYKLA